jgi:monoamine oxidase
MPARSIKTKTLNSLFKAFSASHQAARMSTKDVMAIYEEKAMREDRRRFLGTISKAGIATGIAGLYSSCQSKRTQPSIAIVGGGIAGLYAMHILKKAGLEATIYEASQRCGGRIFTVKDMMGPGLWTEMGAEFIDTNHEDIHALCKEFNLPLLDRNEDFSAGLKEYGYFFNNRSYTFEDIVKEMVPFRQQMIRDVDSLSDEINFESFTDADKKFDNMSIMDYVDSVGVKGWLRNMFDVAYTSEYGTDASKQSAISMLSLFNPANEKKNDLFGPSDERYSVIGGNHQISENLEKLYKEKVNFNHYLTAISQNNSKQYILSFKLAGGKMTDIQADYVIMTIPFSILREVDIRIPLPDWKKNAIQNMTYGQSTKIFLGVKERLWREQGFAGYLFSDNGLQNGYDGTQMQGGNKGRGGFTINLGGEHSIKMGNMTPKQLEAAFLPLLDACYTGAKDQYNGICQRWYWPGYALSKGSYTGFTVGQYTTLCGATTKTVDNLYFAGEHCSYEFQGFMNGAAKTGREAAEAIIKKLNS